MFIAHLSDGQILSEGSGVTWDKVPDGISLLEVTTFGNETITLPKCESYFFSHEAKAYMMMNTSNMSVNPSCVTTADIIGGILGDKAIYIRIEAGHIQIKWKEKKDLPFISSVYRKGI